jgi:MoxR-like ATPase
MTAAASATITRAQRSARSGSRQAKAEPSPEATRLERGSTLAGLGIIGLQSIEPVLVAALISAEPLLLIGPHGTGKSYLLARLCKALELSWRHYNASMLNFDDLVGYPLPDGRGGLEYVQTPSSIWQAEAVFVDEISRCRPDMQNKLFPIVHERKVQGIALERLVYRWSAMNPPAAEEDEEPAYRGTEPLDAALADRFAFVVEMPPWESFTEADQERVIRASDDAIDPGAAAELRAQVELGKGLIPVIHDEYGHHLATYVRMVTTLLGRAGLSCSPRRAGMLLRNVVAVHAARHACAGQSDLSESAWLALSCSLPQRATGRTVNDLQLLAAHREAWSMVDLEVDDPRRLLHAEADPLRRAARAMRIAELSREDLSGLIADSLAGLQPGARHALAVELLETGAAGRLAAAVAEQCAELYALVATAQDVHESVQSRSARHATWQAVVGALARLPAESPDTVLATNLLAGLFGRGDLASEADVTRVLEAWRSARATLGHAA